MENNSNERKKIAMFSIHSDPLAHLGGQESGGQNVYVRYLAEELEKFGWAVDIFTRWDSQHKKQIAFIGRHSRVIRLKGGPVHYVPKFDLLPLLPELFNNFLTFINFQNPYQLFHGHYWDGGWMALESCKRFNGPFVQNFHSLGMIRMETKKRFLKSEEEQDYFAKRLNIENEIIKKSSIIISLSETEKQNLNLLYGCPLEKVIVIPGGVNLKRFRPIEKEKARQTTNLSNNDFIILFVGRLEWRKGIGTLISATRLLKGEVQNLKTIIVGGRIYGRQKNTKDFKEYQRLLKKTEGEDVKDIVQFMGRVDDGQLPSFYSAADVFVIPSYYEPFGLVMLEGMACKVPVVASNVGGLSTTIKDGVNGLLFEPRNALALKEKILLLYKSRDLTFALVENAYKNVIDNYSWQRVVEQICEIYRVVLEKNPASAQNKQSF